MPPWSVLSIYPTSSPTLAHTFPTHFTNINHIIYPPTLSTPTHCTHILYPLLSPTHLLCTHLLYPPTLSHCTHILHQQHPHNLPPHFTHTHPHVLPTHFTNSTHIIYPSTSSTSTHCTHMLYPLPGRIHFDIWFPLQRAWTLAQSHNVVLVHGIYLA